MFIRDTPEVREWYNARINNKSIFEDSRRGR
jgi:hypothetical protein